MNKSYSKLFFIERKRGKHTMEKQKTKRLLPFIIITAMLFALMIAAGSMTVSAASAEPIDISDGDIIFFIADDDNNFCDGAAIGDVYVFTITYGAEPVEVAVVGCESDEDCEVEITWLTTDGKAPINAGTYDAVITGVAHGDCEVHDDHENFESVNVRVIIEPREINLTTPPTATARAYAPGNNAVAVTGGTLTTFDGDFESKSTAPFAEDSGKLSFTLTGATIPANTNAGSAANVTVNATLTGEKAGNYELNTITGVNVTLSKRQATLADLRRGPTLPASKTYDGETDVTKFGFVVEGTTGITRATAITNATHLEVQKFQFNGVDADSNIPVDAGTYTVTAVITSGSVNYTGVVVLGDYTINRRTLALADLDISSGTETPSGSKIYTAMPTVQTKTGLANFGASQTVFLYNGTARSTPPDTAGDYSVSIRVLASTNYMAVDIPLGITFRVPKPAGTALATWGNDSGVTIGDRTLTVAANTPAISGTHHANQVREYAISESKTAPETGWQTGREFTGLVNGRTYYIHVRMAENASRLAGIPQISGELVPRSRAATPNAIIDFVGEELIGLYNVDYKIKIGDEEYTITAASNKFTLAGKAYDFIGKTIEIVRTGSAGVSSDSLPQTIAIPARPAAPTDIGMNWHESDNARRTITGVNKTTMEAANVTSPTTWNILSGEGSTQPIPSGTAGAFLVRFKAVAHEKFASENAYVVVSGGTAATTPTIQINYFNEVLTGFTNARWYTINAGTPWLFTTGDVIEIGDRIGTTLNIVLKGNGTSIDSLPQALVIPARRAAPATVKVEDGKITGVTNAMEISDNDGDSWSWITNSDDIERDEGDYLVRFRATATAFKSETVKVTIEDDADEPCTCDICDGCDKCKAEDCECEDCPGPCTCDANDLPTKGEVGAELGVTVSEVKEIDGTVYAITEDIPTGKRTGDTVTVNDVEVIVVVKFDLGFGTDRTSIINLLNVIDLVYGIGTFEQAQSLAVDYTSGSQILYLLNMLDELFPAE